jgi:threonyl-tRNA synthetase
MVAKKAKKMGLRVEVDKANDRLGKQIRNAEQSRIPIMAIVGEKEIIENSLAIRSRKGENLN